MSGLRRAIALSGGEKYVTLAIHFVSTVIVARLLTPEEIGIYSVGAAAVAIANVLRDFGVTTYLIQEPDIDRVRVRTAFTITLAIGWSLGGVVYLAAPALAGFYGESGVEAVLHVIALNFLLIPFGSVALALLRRDMRFQHMFRVGVASALAHAVVVVSLAHAGLGYMSLAWAAVAGVLVQVAGALSATPQRFVGMPTLREARRVLSFGGRIGLANVTNEVANAAPDLILGRVLGFTTLGYFNRALGFVQLFEYAVIDALRPVWLPYFSRQQREGADVRAAYLRALGYLLIVAWPALATMAMLAPVLIGLLYGGQWGPAVPIAYVLVLAIAVRVPAVLTNAVLTARGLAPLVLRIAAVAATLKVLALLLGAPHGVMAAATGYVLAEALTSLMTLRYAAHRLGFAAGTLWRPMLHAVGVAGGVTGVLAIYVYSGLVVLALDTGLLHLLFCLASALAIWCAALYVLRHPLLLEAVDMLRGRLRRS